MQLEATLEDITNFLDGFELLNHSVTTFHGQVDISISILLYGCILLRVWT